MQFAVAGAIIGVIYKSSSPASESDSKFMKRFVFAFIAAFVYFEAGC